MGNIETISELVQGEMLFESRGYSVVKVTEQGAKIDAKTEVRTPVNIEKLIRIPIKSTGVTESHEKLKAKEPRPPIITEFVKKGSPEGRAQGLTQNTLFRGPDSTDQTYVDAFSAYMQDLQWRLALFAIDVELKMAGGAVAETEADKMAVLKSIGLTGNHINKIVADVTSLSQYSEDREENL